MLQKVSDSSWGVGKAEAGKVGWGWITKGLVCPVREYRSGPGFSSPLVSPALTPVEFVSCWHLG